MDLSLPRGIRDIEPEEYALHSRVRAAFEEVSRVYNFKVMEPASIETIEVLRAKSGEQIDKEIYGFKDKGDRDLGLRFDLTVGITRYVCSKRGLRLPAKMASFGGMWRYDEPQYGRYRWAHQWDFEIFGAPSVDSDAEVIDASASILRRLGLDSVIRVGDRKVVEDFVKMKIGVKDQAKVEDLMRALDKVDKKTRSELEEEYANRGFSREEFAKLMEFGDLKGSPEAVLSRAEEFSLTSTGDLTELRDALKSRGIGNVEYDMSIVRGIDYYTGIVFEAADRKHPRLGSLLGGGRYDTLPAVFGRPDLSATGAAGGVERESMSISDSSSKSSLKAYVARSQDGLYAECMSTVAALRKEGIPADTSPRGRSLGKQLEDANAAGAEYSLILGDREASRGVVTLKNLRDGTEQRLALRAAMDLIR